VTIFQNTGNSPAISLAALAYPTSPVTT